MPGFRSICSAALLLWASTAIANAPADAKALLKAFSTMPGLEADFSEEKRMALLAKPLVSSGKLFFTAKGYLLRRVDKPRPSRVVITPEAILVDDGDQPGQRIDLRTRPDVKLFVESFLHVLRGDHEALASVYALNFVRDGEAWTLALTPRHKPLSDLVTSLRLQGRGLAVHTIHLTESSGDESVTTITNANPARRFTPTEHRELFGK